MMHFHVLVYEEITLTVISTEPELDWGPILEEFIGGVVANG